MEKFAYMNIQSNDSKANNIKSQLESEEDNDDYDETDLTKESGDSNVVRGTIFKDLNIFVEIYNNGINQSDCVIPILIENGAIDGRKKVIQKALDNEIKLINPLWVHDCTTKNSLLKPETYQIKKTYTELLLDNRKRKYNDVVLNTTKSLETPGKRKKLKANSGKSNISPFFLNKENEAKSENVFHKSSLKSGTSISKNDSDKISVLREIKENIPEPKNSVFGNNLRCFREIDNVPSNNFLDKLSKQPFTQILFQTSIKLRPKFPTIFTPLHENKTKTINKERGKIESNPISEESLKQDDKSIVIKQSVMRTYNKPGRSSENKKSKEENKLHPTLTKFNNNTITKSHKRVNSEVLDLKGDKLLPGASKMLSKAHSKSFFPTQTNSTSTKSEVRKLLVINSPDSQELINSEKIVMESINKAIHDGHFQESLNKKKQEATIRFSSIGLNELCKAKIKSTIKEFSANHTNTNNINNINSNNSNLEVFTYTGENYSDIEESEYIVIKNSTTFNYFKEIKTLYVGLLNNNKILGKDIERKFLRYNYFIDSEKKKKFLSFDSYLIKFPSIDFEAIEQLRLDDKMPLKGYKLFLHPESYTNLNETDEVKQEVLNKIVSLLGGKVVNHIRLSDLCIINRVDSSQYFPPHVRNLNTDLIYDTLATLKLQDLDSFKYKPKEGKYKKNRK